MKQQHVFAKIVLLVLCLILQKLNFGTEVRWLKLCEISVSVYIYKCTHIQSLYIYVYICVHIHILHTKKNRYVYSARLLAGFASVCVYLSVSKARLGKIANCISTQWG